LLLKAKGDPNQLNNNGFSAFQLAVKRGHLNVAQSMAKLGRESEVNPKLDINLEHKETGDTSLHLAC
jgi:ankyrin repeat protein